jgi:hypothetical protein
MSSSVSELLHPTLSKKSARASISPIAHVKSHSLKGELCELTWISDYGHVYVEIFYIWAYIIQTPFLSVVSINFPELADAHKVELNCLEGSLLQALIECLADQSQVQNGVFV